MGMPDATTDLPQQLIDYLKALVEASPEITVEKLLHDACYVFGGKESSTYPIVEISRLWEKGHREENVRGLGDRMWKIQDLREAVKGQPVHQVPIAFLDLAAHHFDMEGGLIDFAIHMRHVNESDPDDPVIVDQWGRIIDGRHRLVKALMEGRTTVPMVKIPDGTGPTYYSTTK